jgi:hypothetical protein
MTPRPRARGSMEIGAASESWGVAGTMRAHIPPEPASVGASEEAHRISDPVGRPASARPSPAP